MKLYCGFEKSKIRAKSKFILKWGAFLSFSILLVKQKMKRKEKSRNFTSAQAPFSLSRSPPPLCSLSIFYRHTHRHPTAVASSYRLATSCAPPPCCSSCWHHQPHRSSPSCHLEFVLHLYSSIVSMPLTHQTMTCTPTKKSSHTVFLANHELIFRCLPFSRCTR